MRPSRLTILLISAYLLVGSLWAHSLYAEMTKPAPIVPLPPTAPQSDSVGMIIGTGCKHTEQGTGWVLANNLVATDAHVVAGMDSIVVGWGVNGKEDQNIARVVGYDERTDLALLAVETGNHKPLELSNDVMHMTAYHSFGHPRSRPLEESPLVSTWVLQNPIRGQVYEFDGNVEPGDSGSPILDKQGKVVGIIYATIQGMQALGTPNAPLESLWRASAAAGWPTTPNGTCASKFSV